LAGGRPRRMDSEICPKCGKIGYHYTVPSWNARYKNAPRNFYPRFIHSDRSLKYCFIKPVDSPYQIAKEYNWKKREVSTFQYCPEEINISDIPKQVRINKAIDVIIFSIIREGLGPELKTQLKKLKKIRLKAHEIKWLLQHDKNGYEYLETLPSNDFVACGEAKMIEEDISKLKEWIGKIQWRLDRYGLMQQVLERRKQRTYV
jgi:hypothetical protein